MLLYKSCLHLVIRKVILKLQCLGSFPVKVMTHQNQNTSTEMHNERYVINLIRKQVA